MTVKIGVLGGIGPEATTQFYGRLIKAMQMAGIIEKNEDYPQIIINSIPAPELVGEITDDLIEPYKRGLRELDMHEPAAIVMVCNTIHIYYDELQKDIRSPILDLREVVRKELLRKGVKRVGLLGTTATAGKHLYTAPGIRFITPTPPEQEAIGEAIKNYNRGKDSETMERRVTHIAKRLLESEVDLILVACTELNLMLENSALPILSTTKLMTDATLALIQERRHRES